MTKKAKEMALKALLDDYWTLIKKENMPKTPEITEKLDRLQESIRELRGEKGRAVKA